MFLKCLRMEVSTMKDSRVGESLWSEWEGAGYENTLLSGTTFYTIDHISLDNDLVRRALASTIQRDGISDSLADGFRILENAVITQSWAGYIDSDYEMNMCDETGVTSYGDLVDEVIPVTMVEF